MILAGTSAGNGEHGLQRASGAGTMVDLHSAGGETGYVVRQARKERFSGAELGSSRCGVFREAAVGQGGECRLYCGTLSIALGHLVWECFWRSFMGCYCHLE